MRRAELKRSLPAHRVEDTLGR